MNQTAKQQLSRNPSNAGYATPLKTYSVPATTNPDGTLNVPVQAVYLVDPTREPVAMTGNQVLITDPFGGGPVLQQPIGTAINGGGGSALQTLALQALSNPLTGGYDSVRTPTVFKTLGLTTAAGDTALWDPAAGKKFRLMGVIVDIAAGTTAAAASLLQLRDNAVVISNHTICGGALAASAGRNLVNHVFPGNGYLSVAADNILNLNLSSVLAAGGVTAFVYGTEE